MTLTAKCPSRQILDRAYLNSLLVAFDTYCGLACEDIDWASPDPPDLPDPTLWRRTRADVSRKVALGLLHRDHIPGFIYDAILPSAQRYQQVGM